MISVIIPTLNEAKLLPRLLGQLTDDLRKRFKLEVIISDGGSTDKTLAIAKKNKCQIVIKRPGVNQTIGSARNQAAWHARGDILVFMDADGYLQNPWYFFSQLKQAFSNQQLVAATGRVEVTPEERKWRDWWWQRLFNSLFYLENKVGIGMGRGNCQIVRASAFRQMHGYNERLVAAEDYDLFRRLRAAGKVHFLWQLVFYESPRRFRQHGYLKVFWLWTINSISVLVSGRAWSKKWRRV